MKSPENIPLQSESSKNRELARDTIRRLKQYRKIEGGVDYSQEGFEKTQYNQFRTSWFAPLLGAVEIILDEGMIMEESAELKVRQKLQALTQRLIEVLDEKGRTVPNADRSNDVMMTEADVALGEEIIKLVEPYLGEEGSDAEQEEAG